MGWDLQNLSNKPSNIPNYNKYSEVGLSTPQLKKYFRGNDKLAKLLNQLIGQDPNISTDTEKYFNIGDETFCVELRLNVHTRIWVLKIDDLSRLAKALELKLLPVNRPNKINNLDKNQEFGVSHGELKKYFIGVPAIMLKEIKQIIVEDPEVTKKTSLEIDIKDENFALELRTVLRRRIWAFSKEDMPRLAKAMDWQLKRQKTPKSGLARLVDRMRFISSLEDNAATSMK